MNAALSTYFVMQSTIASPPPPAVGVKILRAAHLGMCFGVRDAIDMAFEQSRAKPLTVLGDLVHNETVLDTLRASGIQIAQQPADVATPAVMITAHGASDKAIERARGHGLEVVEATCPLVRHAHRAIQRLAAEGYYPVIIGRRDHVEVRGLTEDLDQCDIILSEEDVNNLTARDRFGVISQTTQPTGKVRFLVELMRYRFPGSEVRFIDTVCQPTKQRQAAAIELAQKSDVVVVIGGNHSNNTRELVGTCSRFCTRVHHVQDAGDLRLEWFAGAPVIGLTAGTSTPDSIIDEVEQWLRTRIPSI
jgi:4-hydroxy-3-methylbut-2-enyl diphosphate reductase